MKLTIDREADALYLDLDESASFESQEIAPGVILDYNKEGKVVGIEAHLLFWIKPSFCSKFWRVFYLIFQPFFL